MIGIEGAIQTRRYQDKDGNNRTAFEVVANNVQFVESKRNDVNIDRDESTQSFSNASADDFADMGEVGDDCPF
jgi:single-strand DNA-binding protein